MYLLSCYNTFHNGEKIHFSKKVLVDIRRFRIATEGEPQVEIELSARIADKNGKVIASRLVETNEKLDKVEPAAAVSAFDAAFARLAKELIGWTVGSV